MRKLILGLSILAIAGATTFTACKKDEVKTTSTSVSKQSNNYREPSPDGDPLGGNPCAKDETDSVTYQSMSSLPPLGNGDDMYWLRDNILNESYINYYYDLSEYAIDNGLINANNIAQWHQLFVYALQISNTVKNGQSTDIVITNDIYQFCKNQTLITPQSPNYSQVSSIFQVLNADLENLNGLTKSQFIAYFD